jgi:hypothetical protein
MDYTKGIYELQHVDFLKNMNVKIFYQWILCLMPYIYVEIVTWIESQFVDQDCDETFL